MGRKRHEIAETLEFDDDRQFVGALSRGLQVLRAFSAGSGPLSNGELVRETRLPPSTVSRLTHTLMRLGYLRIETGTQRYALTPKVLSLGYPVLAGRGIVDRIRPILEQLAATTGETAALAVRDGLHASFLECIQGRGMLAVRMATGARLPLAVSSAGLALLAASPEKERLAVTSRIRLDLSKRGGDIAAFERNLAAALAQPVAMSRDAWQPGIGGIARAVQAGGELVALVIPVATANVSLADMQGRLSGALTEACRQVE